MAVISKATEANWARLGTNIEGRLERRANKRRSKKTFVPIEYLTSSESHDTIEHIVDFYSESQCSLEDIIHSLCFQQLDQCGLCDENGCLLGYIESSIQLGHSFLEPLRNIRIPDEHDFLGAVYQSLKMEGQKNSGGLYYTPLDVAREMTAGFMVGLNRRVLDPCCGTGSILLSIDTDEPEALYGCDIDELAVLICKVNLFCRYPDKEFSPNIICADYLRDSVFENIEFEYFATNPPWGADVGDYCSEATTITSKESASLFLERTLVKASEGAMISFLLPKAIGNIAVHRDIRSIILNASRIDAFKLYPNLFTGVTTEFFNIVLTAHAEQNIDASVYKKGEVFCVDPRTFESDDHYCFRLLPAVDLEIKKRVCSYSVYSLKDSIWALGIVTGNNKEKLLDEQIPGSEQIFTGRNVLPFRLSDANKYIIYDPNQLQQVAKEEIYRAPKKLVYKFISKKLTFAIDTSGSLCLNSANILIPTIPGLSINSVAGLLNSTLYQYLYLIMFDDPKILKGNLCKMPFPALDEPDMRELDSLVDSFQDGEIDRTALDSLVFEIFSISSRERERVKAVVNGEA